MPVPSDPVIVVLNDNIKLLHEVEEFVRRHSQPPGPAVACFGSNREAERFVIDNRSRIIGYIQDLNRLGDGGSGAGIRFYNAVIEPMTPAAKTIVFSVSIDFHPDFKHQVERNAGDRIRLCSLNGRDPWIRLERLLSWLQSPAQSQVNSPLTELDRELVRVIAPPWTELCRYLAVNPDYLHRLDPRQFELLVGEIFSSSGWEVDFTARTRDGGYDVIAVRHQVPTDLKILIEAKRYAPNRAVGVNVVRSLYGLKALHHVSQLVLATSSYVSKDAKIEFNRVVPWELDFIERDKIIDWCQRYGAVHHNLCST